MLIVQKFHSIHEIDTEFISSIELLLQEVIPNFETLIHQHDNASEGCVFTYFLFFGPTQNAPIGFAQVALRPIPSDKLLPWFKKLAFWKEDHLHWKQMSWKINDGSSGFYIFDPKYARSGKEKIQEILKEYESRPDIMAQELYCIKGLQDFTPSWNSDQTSYKESYVLDALPKGFKSYQDYLLSLDKNVREDIKTSWKELHQKGDIHLGDYQSALSTPQTLSISQEQLNLWEKWGGQVLTFEKDLKVLGCLLMIEGKDGNIFFEPFPFEPSEKTLITDELYTQYALIKFFELPNGRKCHFMKFGSKLSFTEKEDLNFFKSQGFQVKTIQVKFQSRLKKLDVPL